MKKILFSMLPAVLLLACKNTNLYTPVTPVVHLSTIYNNPDAPPPGTPVLETPQAYNQYILDRHQKVQEAVLAIDNNMNRQPNISGSTVGNVVTQINQITAEIKAMPPYRGSDTYRDAAITLFEFYAATYAQGYCQIAGDVSQNSKMPGNETSKAQELLTAISVNEKKLEADFQVEQQKFADTNHFVLANMVTQPRVDYLH